MNEVADYKIACDIREYIEAVKIVKGCSVDSEWIEWANEKADWYDPTIDIEDPLLGKRKHNTSRVQDDLSEYTKKKPYSIQDDDSIPYVDW